MHPPDLTEDGSPLVFLIVGSAGTENEHEFSRFNALICAPDDDSAVRLVLDTLTQRGYRHAKLDQIGNLEGRPQGSTYEDAYDRALAGEVALIFLRPSD